VLSLFNYSVIATRIHLDGKVDQGKIY